MVSTRRLRYRAVDIGLGTVQLGLPYGNRRDAPVMPESEAFGILEAALAARIRFFDTAAAYGESEVRLGRFGLARHPVEISTKVPLAPEWCWRDAVSYESFVRSSLEHSAARLRVNRLALVQLHQCDVDFLRDPGVRQVFDRLLSDGTCAAIGVSVYDVQQAHAALDCDAVTALQVPINIVDTRFADPDLLRRCRERRTRIIARSVLMQGVLVPETPVPSRRRAAALKELRDAATAAAKACGRGLHELALAYVSHLDWPSVVLIGADSLASLQENLTLLRPPPEPIEAGLEAEFSRARQLAAAGRLFDPLTWIDS